jgi:hypothetical protein
MKTKTRYKSRTKNIFYIFIGNVQFCVKVTPTFFYIPLHWLTGGVWTLQAEGRDRARVWFMVIPKDEPPPLSKEQRHCGEDWTTVESCEQHEDDGFDELPIM